LDAQAAVSKDAAEIISRLYGAALSMGEQERAKSFVPDPSDPPALLASKLRKAVEWGKEKRMMQSETARNVAKTRAEGAAAQGGIDALVKKWIK
jgi:hypothetical protein